MEQDVKEIVAKNLTALRKEKGLTQTALAKTINYSDKAVSKWECGDCLPDLNVLCRLAAFYEVSIDYLVSDDEDEKARLVRKDKSRAAVPLLNKIIITCLVFASIFLLATLIFVYELLYDADLLLWRAFVWAVPISCLITLGFLRRWRTGGISRFVFHSILCWSLITCVYLQFFTYSFWYIYIIGIPIQVILILTHQLKRAADRHAIKKTDKSQ